MNIRFKSSDDPYSAYGGYLAVWTPSSVPNGCGSCTFPFTFGDKTFDTCISIEGVDSHPWCKLSPPGAPPVANMIKISCLVSDSSCPSSQKLVTSPNYPDNYPENIDEVKQN